MLEPAQTVDAVEFAVTVGNEFTVIVLVAVLMQPFPSVPVTVYVEVPEGTNETPFVTPPVQL